jgi:hypothetical protein
LTRQHEGETAERATPLFSAGQFGAAILDNFIEEAACRLLSRTACRASSGFLWPRRTLPDVAPDVAPAAESRDFRGELAI